MDPVIRKLLATGISAAALLTCLPARGQAEHRQQYRQPSQDLGAAIRSVAMRSGKTVIAPSELVDGKVAPALDGSYGPEEAVTRLLEGTNLRVFPQAFDASLKRDAQVAAAKARLNTAMSAYRQTMGVQSQVVENVQADAQTLSELVSKSQGAEGALQVAQATNQLLALSAKQQFQIQNMMAAQYRAQSVEQARRAQAEIDGRTTTRKFLGSGSAYTPR